jgi:Bacterial lipoate protein ligase C-terminus
VKELYYIYKSHKLLKIRLNYDDVQNRIRSIFITGDFFLYPERTLEKIENNLTGVAATEDKILTSVTESLKGSQPFGFDAKSLTEAILLCVRQFRAGDT